MIDAADMESAGAGGDGARRRLTDDRMDATIELKMAEVERMEMTPHPVEFDMY